MTDDEVEASKDGSSDEACDTGPGVEHNQVGLHVNTQYPKTNLKRWSTTKKSMIIDENLPSAYARRLALILRRSQSTLPAAFSKQQNAPSTLHYQLFCMILCMGWGYIFCIYISCFFVLNPFIIPDKYLDAMAYP